ncbi:MAG: PTS system trehalose-specific EIIBC component [Lactovum sp.]
MGKFEVDARRLLEAVGGQENIVTLSHCVTRMRFVLKDDDKTNKEEIEKIPSVKGMFTNAGQFQVIIGNEVSEFFNDFSEISGIQGVSKEEGKSAAKVNQSFLQRFATTMAEIFTPILPAIIVGGLILGFRNVLEGVQMEWLGQKMIDGVAATNGDGTNIYNTIVDVSQFWSGVNSFLWLPSQAIFHFLPVGVAWSVVKKFGGTEILGIILGITLVSPELLNAYARPSTTAAEIAANWSWDFGEIFGQQILVSKIGYQAQVLPAIGAALLFVYLEKWLRKRVHESVQMIVVPFFSLIPSIIAAHLLIGPLGWWIGQGLSETVKWALLDNPLSSIFGAIFGALYAPLVITGLHHMLLMIDLQMIADQGFTIQWPMVALSNIAQGAAVAGMIVHHRRSMKNRQEELTREEGVSIPSLISAWLGVTEPAMFGINLKFMYPFVAAMTGSALAGFYVTLTHVKANAVGVGGLPGILAIRADDWLNFFIAMLIAIVVPFFMVFVFKNIKVLNKVD